jgi:hypothetical protein
MAERDWARHKHTSAYPRRSVKKSSYSCNRSPRRQRHGESHTFDVMDMASLDFTIADPDDAGTMDVVGFDPAVP